jgi:putative transposase
MLAGLLSFIEIRQVKNLHNLVEQDHRFIKKVTKPMIGFIALHSAKASIRRDLKSSHD